MLNNETKEKVFQIAQKIFSTKPLKEISLNEIAAESGVELRELREEFKSPEELLCAVLTRGIEEATKLFIRMIDARGKADIKLSRLVRELMRQYEEFAPLFRLVSINFLSLDEIDLGIHGTLTKEQIDKYRQNTAIIGRIIAQGQSEGLFSRDIDPLEAAYLLRGMINWAIKHWQYLGKEEPLANHAELVSRIFLKGVYK